MFSEGIHSLVDTGNQILLLFGMKRAQKPADKNYPFGYGKEIYFWSFVVAILIFAVGAGISIYEGIKHINSPQAVENPLINFIVLGIALVFEELTWAFALREFSRAKGKWAYVEAVRKGNPPCSWSFSRILQQCWACSSLSSAYCWGR
jgi:divalent metal cation (Fe/Co/Zn/Cd) transporter